MEPALCCVDLRPAVEKLFYSWLFYVSAVGVWALGGQVKVQAEEGERVKEIAVGERKWPNCRVDWSAVRREAVFTHGWVLSTQKHLFHSLCVLCSDTFVYVYNIFLSNFTYCNYINTVEKKTLLLSLLLQTHAKQTCFSPHDRTCVSDSQDIHTYINILHAERNKPRSMVNPVMSWQRFSSH